MPVFGIAPSSFAEGAGAGGAGAVGAVTGAVGAPALSAVPVETAFVLSGGGNRGACQVGMLRALCERGIAPDLVVGSSIGAINAAFFAGQPTLEGTYRHGRDVEDGRHPRRLPEGPAARVVAIRRATGGGLSDRGVAAIGPRRICVLTGWRMRSYRSPSSSHVSTTAPKCG